MNRERARLAQTAMLAVALIAFDVLGTRLFDTLALAERLFAGGAWGAVALVSTAALLCGRLALCLLLPGYLLAAVGFWSLAELKRLHIKGTRSVADT